MATSLAVWAQALILTSLIVFFLLGMLMYYLTSDAWRNRQMKKKLGHEVPSLAHTLCRCFIVCLGPVYRKRWERENKYYRTDDYGQPSSGVLMPLSASHYTHTCTCAHTCRHMYAFFLTALQQQHVPSNFTLPLVFAVMFAAFILA